MRNIGGSVGIALATTLLAQRSQYHQTTLVSHITAWDLETRERLTHWASHFVSQGSDAFTAQRRAVAMLYKETVAQAQLLAYVDDFWMLALMFSAILLFLPFMRRIRMPSPSPGTPRGERATEPAPSHPVEEGVA
jgi:DHA2 family multidrug resistance protein